MWRHSQKKKFRDAFSLNCWTPSITKLSALISWPPHHLPFFIPCAPLPAPSMFPPSLWGWGSPEFQLLPCTLPWSAHPLHSFNYHLHSNHDTQLYLQPRLPWASDLLLFCWISLFVSQISQTNYALNRPYPSLYPSYFFILHLGYWHPFKSLQARNLINTLMPFAHHLTPKSHIQLATKLCLCNSSFFCSFLWLLPSFRCSLSLTWTWSSLHTCQNDPSRIQLLLLLSLE